MGKILEPFDDYVEHLVRTRWVLNDHYIYSSVKWTWALDYSNRSCLWSWVKCKHCIGLREWKYVFDKRLLTITGTIRISVESSIWQISCEEYPPNLFNSEYRSSFTVVLIDLTLLGLSELESVWKRWFVQHWGYYDFNLIDPRFQHYNCSSHLIWRFKQTYKSKI